MKFKDILNHFEIQEEFPEYLLDESFNDIFLNGDLSIKDNSYEIVAETRKDVTHQMIIEPNNDFPVIIMSILPNGNLNGMKFGKSKGETVFINEL